MTQRPCRVCSEPKARCPFHHQPAHHVRRRPGLRPGFSVASARVDRGSQAETRSVGGKGDASDRGGLAGLGRPRTPSADCRLLHASSGHVVVVAALLCYSEGTRSSRGWMCALPRMSRRRRRITPPLRSGSRSGFVLANELGFSSPAPMRGGTPRRRENSRLVVFPYSGYLAFIVSMTFPALLLAATASRKSRM